MEEVTLDDLHSLLSYFSKYTYKAVDNESQADAILKKCQKLLAKDYKYSIIYNTNGELSGNYPAQIFALEAPLTEGNEPGKGENSVIVDAVKLRDLFTKARFARCRARFPVPVILFDGKFVCRSATLSGGPEIYGRTGYDLLFSGGESIPAEDDFGELPFPQASSSDWQLFNRIRGLDIKLLKALNIGYICDLMVEKKKVKFGMNITSSEKVDKENRYSEFSILSVPYPGCEFFRKFCDNGYTAEGLMFDWGQSHVDTELDIPPEGKNFFHNIEWHIYKSWDLLKLTQNYLKLFLAYLTKANTGLLIHCISGWDRTPLFISLIRLSLWADGRIHETLTPLEILYVTLAYDWFLFGHNLVERLTKGEEILFFCFYLLKYIISEEFSVKKRNAPRQISFTEGDLHIDGILLESDLPKLNSSQGSSSSLNSNISITSGKSQDAPPLYFSTNSEDMEETFTFSQANGNLNQTVASHRLNLGDSSPNGCFNRPITTSPVAVPSNIRRQRSGSNSSAGCGSWQIISATGSLRGSAFKEHLQSDSPDTGHNNFSQKYCDVSEVNESSLRKERLDSIRSIFYQAYCATIGFKFNNGPDGGGISSFLDQVAEKVGIRSGRTTSV